MHNLNAVPDFGYGLQVKGCLRLSKMHQNSQTSTKFRVICQTSKWIYQITPSSQRLTTLVKPFTKFGEIWHLGIFIVRSRVFKCSLDHPKCFYRSAKVGRIASDKVALQLLNSKCVPVLLCSLQACPLLKSDLTSMDFVCSLCNKNLLIHLLTTWI